MPTINSQTAHNVYVHVPFCSGKCTYCGFFSVPYTVQQAERYLDTLENEIRLWAVQCQNPKSVYIGGGTPSLLTRSQWKRLCRIIREVLNPVTEAEWTVEANPGKLNREILDLWIRHGVNRISLGVQSMCDATLARIQRRHNSAETIESLRLLRQAGFKRIGMDLIACLPGVSLSEWEDTLNSTINLNPDHVSVYACSIEPGTGLEQEARTGQFVPADEAAEMEAVQLASDCLASNGFEHYEISNYARPGERCRYNVNVWKGEDYIGFGPSAASRLGQMRWTHTADLESYFETAIGRSPPRESELLSDEMDAAERLCFRFRLSDAVDLEAFVMHHGDAAMRLFPFWRKTLETLAGMGLLTHSEEGWKRTAKGLQLADEIAAALLPDAAEVVNVETFFLRPVIAQVAHLD